jgi:hypothetical protein
MEKIQENSGIPDACIKDENTAPSAKKTKRFLLGIICIVGSSIGGWISVFVCNLLAIKYGKKMVALSGILYALSWIPFGIGFILAGPEGVFYVKKIFRRVLRK